eukprot:4616227-Pyramimonas_sp.AAC.1
MGVSPASLSTGRSCPRPPTRGSFAQAARWCRDGSSVLCRALVAASTKTPSRATCDANASL